MCRPDYPYIHKKKKSYLRLRQVIMRSNCHFEKNKEQDLKKSCDTFILLMGLIIRKLLEDTDREAISSYIALRHNGSLRTFVP